MFTEQLPDLLDYINNLPGQVCLAGDKNIHFDNPLQSLTKQTLTTLSLYDIVQVISKPIQKSVHIIDLDVVQPDDDIHRKSTVIDCEELRFNIRLSPYYECTCLQYCSDMLH